MTASCRGYTELAARIFISTIFLLSGVGKIMNWSGAAESMSKEGMVAVPLFLAGAVAIELGAGVALLAGCWTRAAATALIVFLVPTTLIFHDFWTFEEQERQMQMISFLKNVAILGGLLKFAADGAGRVSFDACCTHATTGAAPSGTAHNAPGLGG
jgi:putative oxidoreductase